MLRLAASSYYEGYNDDNDDDDDNDNERNRTKWQYAFVKNGRLPTIRAWPSDDFPAV